MIEVVAAALIDRERRILIAQRPPGSQLAGGWEFPGGKSEPGEAQLAALARELQEELGISLGEGPHRPLLKVVHVYGARSVRIDLWVVTDFKGEAQGLEGQALRWCSMPELEATELLPADAPMVRALRLPERLSTLATDVYEVASVWKAAIPGPRNGTHRLLGALCSTVEEAHRAAEQAEFIVLKQALPDTHLATLCAALAIPVYAAAIDLPSAWRLGATGVSDLAVR